jgi:type II secretory pathway component PulC
VFEKVDCPMPEQKRKALMIHCFVIEKRDGRIKARAVADGGSQQRYTEKETYSATVKLESIMLNVIINAYEGRHVVTVDIKGAFLKAKVPDHMDLIVKVSGDLMMLMYEINPSLRSDNQPILYLRCKKAAI